MHPLSPYHTDKPQVPEIERLQRTRPAFERVRHKRGRNEGRVDWSRKDAAEVVARGLLESDFGIAWSAGRDGVFLTPAVPRSVNYLEWVRDLLAVAARPGHETIVDIGTGASCILPLIGCSPVDNRNSAWRFIGTEIDARAVQHAERLIRANGLGARVTVAKVSAGTYLAGALTPALDTIPGPLASVCNPPFFSTYHPESPGLAPKDKQSQPHKRQRLDAGPAETDFRGTSSEKAFAQGGELAFFRAMLLEMAQSQRLCARITWATCMFGHKASVRAAFEALEALDRPVAVAATWLVQGRKLRWAVAWSFQPDLVRLQARPIVLSRGKTDAGGHPLFFTLAAARDRLERSPHKQHPMLVFKSPVNLEETRRRLDDFWESQPWQVSRHPILHADNVRDDYFQERVVVCLDGGLGACLAVVVTPQQEVRLAALVVPQGDEAAVHNLFQRVRTDVVRESRFWKRRARREQEQG